MGLFKNWKPKTIVGKLLKGAASVAVPIGAAVAGIGAVTGIAKGVGALAGIGGVLEGGKKVIDTVGGKAVNLITGTTKEEREQIQEVKATTKAVQDKYDQVDRLIKAGATKAAAYATVGLSLSDASLITPMLAEAGTISKDSISTTAAAAKLLPIAAGLGILFFLILPILKKRR